MRDRPPRYEVGPGDSELDESILMVRAAGTTLGASLLAAVGTSLVGLDAVVSVGVVLASGGLGCLGSLAAAARRRRRSGQVPLSALDPADAQRVRSAGAEAERLHRLARSAPPGPVAEHLSELADTADDYVTALRAALHTAGPRPRPGPSGLRDDRLTGAMTEEADAIVAQLRELTAAAEDLRRAQRRALEPSRLEELIDRTRRLAETIEAEHPALDPGGRRPDPDPHADGPGLDPGPPPTG